jgi:hypothetical protein
MFRMRNATEDMPVRSLPFLNEISEVLWCELRVSTQINALLLAEGLYTGVELQRFGPPCEVAPILG